MLQIEDLPLFPLGLVLYPGERIPLHIFEPRYRALAQRCVANDEPFGIVLNAEGTMASVGCTARITRVVEAYEDGRYDILVDGEARFAIRRLHEESPYLTADVDLLAEPPEPLERAMRERMITQHMRLLELVGRPVRPSLYQTEASVSFRVAPFAGLTPEQKQEVLELPTENERIAYLVAHLEALIPNVEAEEALRRKVQSNGHFEGEGS